ARPGSASCTLPSVRCPLTCACGALRLRRSNRPRAHLVPGNKGVRTTDRSEGQARRSDTAECCAKQRARALGALPAAGSRQYRARADTPCDDLPSRFFACVFAHDLLLDRRVILVMKEVGVRLAILDRCVQLDRYLVRADDELAFPDRARHADRPFLEAREVDAQSGHSRCP